MAYDLEIILTSVPVSNLFNLIKVFLTNNRTKPQNSGRFTKHPKNKKQKTNKQKQNVNLFSLFSGYK